MSGPDAVQELKRLAEEVEVCTRCDLYRDAQHGVPGEGPAGARIMLVGEGPGRNEDQQGRPFVGTAGRFLSELLAEAGLRRDEVYITNVVKHRPTKIDANGTVGNRAPSPDEVGACRVYLDRQIAAIRPRVIVTLGAHSLGAFFPGQSIMRIHGSTRQKDGVYYFHSFHPAAALYKDELKETMLQDMRTLGRFLKSLPEERESLPDTPPQDTQAESGDDPEQLTLF